MLPFKPFLGRRGGHRGVCEAGGADTVVCKWSRKGGYSGVQVEQEGRTQGCKLNRRGGHRGVQVEQEGRKQGCASGALFHRFVWILAGHYKFRIISGALHLLKRKKPHLK